MEPWPPRDEIKVLLVEDDEISAGLIRDILADQGPGGFRLLEVPSLAQAREVLERAAQDVIVADLGLPDSQGMDTLTRLRETAPDTPIVVVTGSEQAHLDDAARRLGAQDFLYKHELHPRLLPRVLRFAVDRAAYARRLRRSEAVNRRIIEQAQDVIYRIDREGRFIFLNPAVEALTGYQPQELLGKSFLSLVSPEHREAVLEHYRRQLEDGIRTTYLELPFRNKTGGERWAGQHVWLAELEDGSPGFEAIARDITELRQALANLEESRVHLEKRVIQRTRELQGAKLAWESTFDAVPEMIVITDAKQRIVRANRSAAVYTGRSLEKILGWPLEEVFPWLAGGPTADEAGDGAISREVHDPEHFTDFLVSTSRLPGLVTGSPEVVHVARDVTRLKQAERTGREQLRFLRVVIDAIPSPLYFKDKYGKYTGCNTAFEEYVGKSQAELVGWDVTSILKPSQAQLMQDKDRELLQAGGVQVFTSQVEVGDRGPRDLIHSKAVLRDSNGGVDGLVGVLQDITELRSAETALRASEEQFRTLFEHAPISIWLEDFAVLKRELDRLTASGVRNLEAYFTENPRELSRCRQLIQVVNVNAFTLDLFEARSKNELLGNLSRVFQEDSLPAFQQEIVSLYSGAEGVSLAGYNHTLRGKRLHVLINVTLAPGAEETWDQVLVTVLDDTDRLETEAALRESEKVYRGLVEALTEGLLRVDENAVIRFCNQRFGEMIGYPEEELLGRPVTELLDEQNKGTLVAHFAARKKGDRGTYELTMQTKSGKALNILVSPCPLFDAEGVFRGSNSLITDLTAVKSLEYQLRQSQKMEAIGQLAAGIAHEINTPTQYVASNSKFLQQGFEDLARYLARAEELVQAATQAPLPPEPVEEFQQLAEEIDLEFLLEEIPQALETNIEGLNRIAVIVRSMKEFAHPGREEKQPVDLNQIIDSTVTVARNEWKYVAEVKTELDPNLPPVTCVSNEIKQVVLNIVVNAAQAIGEIVTEGVDAKGQITIKSAVEGSRAVITISDTGPGISPELFERVFDPFFTTKEPGKGTGQGLAIAYRAVVENHGGSLTLGNRPEGGAVFQIKLPLGGTDE